MFRAIKDYNNNFAEYAPNTKIFTFKKVTENINKNLVDLNNELNNQTYLNNLLKEVNIFLILINFDINVYSELNSFRRPQIQ